jgi:primase-polymerase (primpol)-like protein
MTPPKPQAPAVQVDAIPGELKARPLWVTWRYAYRDGKWTKVPLNAKTGRRASSTDKTTWAPFTRAFVAYRTGRADGVGFMFADDDPYTGVDLDDCLDDSTGGFNDQAVAILSRLNSYSEVSPSGRGIKVWIKGKLPPGSRCKEPKRKIEMYSSRRFFTVTGRVIAGGARVIADRQVELTALHAEIFSQKAKAKPSTNGTGPVGGVDDEGLLARATKAKNGGKFSNLFYRGDTSDYGNDDSAADQALTNMLAFWTTDKTQIDRLFRRSALKRAKWDERRGRQTYGERTIDSALAYVAEHY